MDQFELMAEGLGAVPESERNTSTLAQLAQVIDRARDIVTSFRAEADALRKQGELSETGLDKRLSDLANRELERLDSVAETALQRARGRLEVLRHQVAQLPQKKTNDAAATALAIEIRAALRAMDDSDRIAVLTEAAASGDRSVLGALFQIPVFMQQQLVSIPEIRADLRAQFQEAGEPAAVGEIRDLEGAIQRTANAAQRARTIIGSTSGLSSDSSVTILAQLGPRAA